MQAASIGLLIAARRFDLENHGDKKFSAYASYYVRNEINGLIADIGFSTTIPRNVVREIGKFHLYDLVESKYGYDDIISEAQIMGLPVNRAVDVSKAIYRFLYSPSLDEYDDETDDYLFETMADESISNIEDEIIYRERLSCVNDILNKHLTEKERTIIHFRFGFVGNGDAYTLQQVGELLGVGRERIRQLERKIIFALKAQTGIRLLYSA